MTLTTGRKASLVMMHNRNRTISDMAEITKACPKEIRAFLETRNGFPGRIISSKVGGKVKASLSQYGTVYVSPVTLPTLKFMQGAE
jgi:hypothetical protein